MKVAISATEETLDASIDPRFGRCNCLLIVDARTRRILGGGPNAFAASLGGAGTRVARWAIDEGAEVVLTGNLGPNAREVLRAGCVRVITGASGTVAEALDSLVRSGRWPADPRAPSPTYAEDGKPSADRGSSEPCS